MGAKIKLRVSKNGDYIPISGAAESLIINAVSPVVTFEKVEGGTKMIVTDVDGEKETIIYDGDGGLEFDDTPTNGSGNPVTSNGIYNALDRQEQDLMTFINGNTTRIDKLDFDIGLKQNKLFFDSTPTNGSENPVTSGGVYAALHNSNAVTVSGATPSIMGEDGKRYICGTLERLTITPSPSGVFSVRFTSGETPTIVLVPNWVLWADGFDPSSLEANKVYRLSFEDAKYAKADVWS